jgi:hypothetical protein
MFDHRIDCQAARRRWDARVSALIARAQIPTDDHAETVAPPGVSPTVSA